MRTVRRLGALLAAVGLLAILTVTLAPNPRQTAFARATPLHCLVCGEAGGADVVLNLILFVPMTVGLTLAGWSWRRAVVTGAIVSLAVESAQYFVVAGRDASLSDVITNTTSGAIGAALGSRLGLLLLPAPALAGRLSLAAAAAWVGVLGFTAAAMQPWAPPGRLRMYCTAAYPTAEVFTGTARGVTLNGTALTCDREVPGATAVGSELRRGAVTLEAAAETVEPFAGRHVFALLRSARTSLVVLAQQGRTVVFQPPAAGQAVRLYPASVRLSGSLPAPGGTVALLGEGLPGGRMRVTAMHGGERRSAELALSPSFGWTLLFGGGLEPGTRLRIEAALWLAALIVPAAYWAGRVARVPSALGVLAAAVAGLGAVPAAAGFQRVHWSEWAGAAGGIALGWALSRIAAYLQSRCGSPSTSAYSSS